MFSFAAIISISMRLIFFLIAVTFLYSPVNSQYFPAQNWEKKINSTEYDNTLLDSIVSVATKQENKVERDLRIAVLKSYAREPGYKIHGPMKERGGPAGLIIKNGYIIKEWGDVQRVDMCFSVTKSIISMVAGIAYDKGLVASFNDKVTQYVWDGTFEGTHNGAITWEHLLHQNSDWSGCQYQICDWADRPPRTGEAKDWELRTLNPPGSVMEYNDARVNALSYALTHVLRKPLAQVFRDEVMNPVGAGSTWRWYGYDDAFTLIDGQMMQVASGGGHFGGGLFINTLDMARIGLLMQNDGVWKGKRILSERYIEKALSPSKTNENYGYLWWLNTNKKLIDVPQSVFYANGFGGNYIIVDKTNQLTIVLRWIDTEAIDDIISLAIKATSK
jgi:CubicO group peptidase (beta-lactamase class C family)